MRSYRFVTEVTFKVKFKVETPSLFFDKFSNTILSGIDHHGQDAVFATCGDSVDIWDENNATPINRFSWGVDTIHNIHFNQIEVSMWF